MLIATRTFVKLVKLQQHEANKNEDILSIVGTFNFQEEIENHIESCLKKIWEFESINKLN